MYTVIYIRILKVYIASSVNTFTLIHACFIIHNGEEYCGVSSGFSYVFEEAVGGNYVLLEMDFRTDGDYSFYIILFFLA
jgi:hypothetical protein